MEVFTYQIMELTDGKHLPWRIVEQGTAEARYADEILDRYDFGHVEQELVTYSDGTVERVWNRAYDDFDIDRVGIIVMPTNAAPKAFPA